MKILFVSHYYLPERAAPVSRVVELCRVWRELGHEPSVLTGFPHFPHGKILPGYRLRLCQRETIDQVDVRRVWVWPVANRGVLKRSLSFLSFVISACIYALPSKIPADVVIATSPQLFTGLVGAFVAWRCKIPFVFEVRDLWPDSIAALNVVKESFFIRFLRQIERFIYRRASLIVVLAENYRSAIVNKGVNSEKVVVIPNGANTELFSPATDSRALATELMLSDQFVVSYIGNFATAYDFDAVIEAAEYLSQDSAIRFLLVGDGVQYEKVKAQIAAKHLSNVTLRSSIDRSEVPKYLAASNLSLIPLKDSPFSAKQRASKAYEIMSMGIPPIVSLRSGEMYNMFSDHQVCFFIEPGSGRVLAEKLLELKNHPQLIKEFGERARRLIEDSYSIDRLARDYLGFIAQLRKSN